MTAATAENVPTGTKVKLYRERTFSYEEVVYLRPLDEETSLVENAQGKVEQVKTDDLS
jgi:hypothetical protein